jgi:hypothetical protein
LGSEQLDDSIVDTLVSAGRQPSRPSGDLSTNTKAWIGYVGNEWCDPIHGPQYEGIANTIVQLIRQSTSGVISPSQPIRWEERHNKTGLAASLAGPGGKG